MKSEWVRRFIRLASRGEAMFSGTEIALRPRIYSVRNRQIGCEHAFVFDIVELAGWRVAGEIALRIGESAEQFYLGHVGYHVDPPFRGHAYAAEACRLISPLLAAFGLRSAVITTDPTNVPSIKTCLRLGCRLECTVQVPEYIREKLDISAEKRRYIWCP